jgi:hypothetical protein
MVMGFSKWLPYGLGLIYGIELGKKPLADR